MTDKYILAVDQGTTSTRAIVFNHEGRIVGSHQLEHEQIFPRAGWVEHNAKEIWDNTQTVIAGAMANATVTADHIAAVGITNQRETTLVWDKKTAQPVYNAIVWQDTRTAKIVDDLGGGNQDKYKAQVGLPLATYFSGPKVKWVLDNVEGAREKAEAGDLVMGNMDTWVIWNLTGGPDGGKHVTDVTNASRTMLMNLDTLSWNESIAADMGIPMSMLPEIRSSSEVYGECTIASLKGIPVAGDLGDQQAATFGQACFEPGMAKNTYGTGCFMISNTGKDLVPSENGLLTTVCYKIGEPGGFCELGDELGFAGQRTVGDVDDAEVLPVRPPFRDRHGQPATVARHREELERGRAVGRPGVRIEDDPGVRVADAVETVGHVPHVLRLRAVVAVEEVPPPLHPRDARPGARHDPRQGVVEPVPVGQRGESGLGVAALGVDPGLDLSVVGVLEPPVGIGDLATVQGLDEVVTAGVRVCHLRSLGSGLVTAGRHRGGLSARTAQTSR